MSIYCFYFDFQFAVQIVNSEKLLDIILQNRYLIYKNNVDTFNILSHMNVTMNDDYPDPVETALNIIGGKYKPLIIWYLQNETLRYSELKTKLARISPRMLSKQLKELEQDQIIARNVYPQVPVRVEYSLSELGTRCIPILEALYFWGSEYLIEKGYNIPKKNK